MEMQVSDIGGVTHAKLIGRLDANGADAISLKFTAGVAATGKPAVVDLSEVSFVASLGLRLLISTARTLHSKGAKLALYGANALVQEVFDDAALDQILPIVPDEAAAVAALSA